MHSDLAESGPIDWKLYGELWKSSLERSPFQGPNYLEYLERICKKNKVPVANFHLVEDQKMVAAILLMRKGGMWYPLSDLGSDFNTMVLDKEANPDPNMILHHIKETFSDLSISLSKTPDWWVGIDTFLASSFIVIKSSVSPCVEASANCSISSVFDTDKLKYYQRRIERELGYEFEVISDETDLDTWAREFSQNYYSKWQPEAVHDSRLFNELVLDFKEKLGSWIKDKVLVRFALLSEGKRISMVAGLVQNKRFIYHKITHDPTFNKYSPGKALLRSIANWADEKGFEIFDFGDGNEKYKYSFANRETTLYKLDLISKIKVGQVVRSKTEKFIKENPWLYQKWLKYAREK